MLNGRFPVGNRLVVFLVRATTACAVGLATGWDGINFGEPPLVRTKTARQRTVVGRPAAPLVANALISGSLVYVGVR